MDGWSAKQHLGVKPEGGKINCPESLPVAITTSNDEGLSKPKYLFKLGKQILKLYKSGISNVWKNHRESKRLMKQYGISGVGSLTRHVQDSAFAQGLAKNGVIKPSENHITRAQYQKMLRSAGDIKKLPTFALIFAVFFEFTPLVVMAFPRITPSTCILPFQQTRDLKAVDNAIRALKSYQFEKRMADSTYQLSREELNALGRVFFYRQIMPVGLYPRGYLENKVKTHIDRVKSDNVLLSRFGSVNALDRTELYLACLDRAIPVNQKSETQLRADLFFWMTNFAERNYDAGFFFYPLATTEQEAQVVNKTQKIVHITV